MHIIVYKLYYKYYNAMVGGGVKIERRIMTDSFWKSRRAGEV